MHVAVNKTNVANKVTIHVPLSQGSNQPLKKPVLKLLQFTPFHKKVNVSFNFFLSLSFVLISTELLYLSLSAVLGMGTVLPGSQCLKIFS